MTVQKRQLLETLHALHDETGEPITATHLARHLGIDRDAVREQLRVLYSYELVKPAPTSPETGYVPTVTGREFLELDIDQDKFVIVERGDDE